MTTLLPILFLLLRFQGRERRDVKVRERPQQPLARPPEKRGVVELSEVLVPALARAPLPLEAVDAGLGGPRAAPVPHLEAAAGGHGHGLDEDQRERLVRPELGLDRRGEILDRPVEVEEQQGGDDQPVPPRDVEVVVAARREVLGGEAEELVRFRQAADGEEVLPMHLPQPPPLRVVYLDGDALARGLRDVAPRARVYPRDDLFAVAGRKGDGGELRDPVVGQVVRQLFPAPPGEGVLHDRRRGRRLAARDLAVGREQLAARARVVADQAAVAAVEGERVVDAPPPALREQKRQGPAYLPAVEGQEVFLPAAQQAAEELLVLRAVVEERFGPPQEEAVVSISRLGPQLFDSDGRHLFFSPPRSRRRVEDSQPPLEAQERPDEQAVVDLSAAVLVQRLLDVAAADEVEYPGLRVVQQVVDVADALAAEPGGA